MFVFTRGAADPQAIEVEADSLMQAKVTTNSAVHDMHNHALEIAAALGEVESLRASKMLAEFTSNATLQEQIHEDTFKVIQDIIDKLNNTLKKTLREDHILDKQELSDEITNETDVCHKHFSNDTDSDNALLLLGESLGATHRTLRESLIDAILNRTTHCNEMDRIVTNVPKYQCEAPDPPPDDDALDSSQVVENYMQELEGVLTALNPFEAQKQSCVETLDKQEKDETAATDGQANFESAMCSVRISSLSSCLNYDECYQALRDNLASTNHWLKGRVKHRKLEWDSITRMECVLQVLIGKPQDATPKQRKEMMANCYSDPVDVSFLNITIPSFPVQETCNLTAIAVYPGTAGFRAKWYKDTAGKDYPGLSPTAPCSIPSKYDAVTQ